MHFKSCILCLRVGMEVEGEGLLLLFVGVEGSFFESVEEKPSLLWKGSPVEDPLFQNFFILADLER